LILVDTSVWVDFFNPVPTPQALELYRLIADADQPIALAGIVVTEILQGLRRDADIIEHFLRQWTLLEPTGFDTYAQAGAIFRVARSKGLTVTTTDTLIAAIALSHHAQLFTSDNDFTPLARLTGLRLYRPPQ